jgi:peptide-methionine (S)-S-oxide reductase
MKYLSAFYTIPLLFLSSPAVYAAELETAILAGGCFWCVESDYDTVSGVTDTVSGYIGGSAETARYKQISKGGTGHYESVKITYDSSRISYAKILDIFWRSVDATDTGGQFCDRGDSYKTAIFALSDHQYEIAQKSKNDLDVSGRLPAPVATTIQKAGVFYPAEEYHQNYYLKTGLVLTRYGLISKKEAYKKYRQACGRDARVIQLWGNDAFVIAGQ